MYNSKNKGAFASSQARAKTPNIHNKVRNDLHFTSRRTQDLLVARYGLEGAAKRQHTIYEAIELGIDPLNLWAKEYDPKELLGYLGY